MLEGLRYDWDARKIDPRMGDGLFYGASRDQINADGEMRGRAIEKLGLAN